MSWASESADGVDRVAHLFRGGGHESGGNSCPPRLKPWATPALHAALVTCICAATLAATALAGAPAGRPAPGPAATFRPVRSPAATFSPNWWSADWPYRVRIECKPGDGDVAWVRVLLAGRTMPEGRDLRLVDADGNLRNFEVVHHDPRLSTLIQFKVPPNRPLRTWLYYGHASASPINTSNPQFGAWRKAWEAWNRQQKRRQKVLRQRLELEEELERVQRDLRQAQRAGGDTQRLERRIARLEAELGASAADGATPAPAKPKAWYPRRGVLLKVYRKAKPGHPKTLTKLHQLVSRSVPEGACFCYGISDGFNRFGPSDEYISVYEGYLQIEQPGEYEFCTVSDDGSWVRVNDRTVVEWPGAHGWHGAERGEKSGAIKLGRGVARVQYYHEEASGDQMAFLGWRPPDAERFTGVPRDAWLSVRPARAIHYEAHAQPLLAVAAGRVKNTYWVRDSDDRQATLVEFRSRTRSRAGEVVSTRWSFGDGLEGEGQKTQHVYFRTRRPEVKLTVVDAAGNTDSIVCSPNVFHVDVRARYFRFGNARQYAEAASGYDVARMAGEDLQLYAEFWGYLEKWPEHVRAADVFIRRFPDSPAAAQLAISAAKGCTQPDAYNPGRAAELYALALQAAKTPRERLELTLRRAQVLAWGLGDHEQAAALLNDAISRAGSKDARAWRRLHRQAVIGLGDVALLSEEYGAADRLYRQAQAMTEPAIAQEEMLAKIGGYGYTVSDLLARDEFEWALEVLRRWEDEFPTQKLEGYTFFLRGKVLFVRRPGPLALRQLELAQRVSPRAVHVPEAVWLRANCLLALERHEEALAEFQRIRADFTQSEFFQRAAEKIKLCESELAHAGPADVDE